MSPQGGPASLTLCLTRPFALPTPGCSFSSLSCFHLDSFRVGEADQPHGAVPWPLPAVRGSSWGHTRQGRWGSSSLPTSFSGKPSWKHNLTSTMDDLSMGRSRGRGTSGGFGVGALTQGCSLPVLCCGVHRGAGAWGAHGRSQCCSSSCSLQRLAQAPEPVTVLQTAQHHSHSDAPLPVGNGPAQGSCHPVCDQQG